MFNKEVSIKALVSHIALFIFVEIVFVLIVFREFPETNLYSTIGIAHIFYRIVVIICSLRREQAKTLIQRFAALRTPMVFHLFIHIRIGLETVQEHTDGGHEHHEGELLWLIIGTLVAGVIIYGGEKLIHKNNYCKTHHQSAHKDCLKKECNECITVHK